MEPSHEYRMLYSGDHLGSWAFFNAFFNIVIYRLL